MIKDEFSLAVDNIIHHTWDCQFLIWLFPDAPSSHEGFASFLPLAGCHTRLGFVRCGKNEIFVVIAFDSSRWKYLSRT